MLGTPGMMATSLKKQTVIVASDTRRKERTHPPMTTMKSNPFHGSRK